MGNGALPHGPSYRAHPRLYLSGGSQGGEFTSAFGGVAKRMDGRPRLPPRLMTHHRHWLCTAAIGFDAGIEPLSKYSFEPIQCCLLSWGTNMRRREFISLFGGAAAWPLAVRAQQPIGPVGKMPRIGILMPGSSVSSEATLKAFYQGLHELGYFEGQNVAIERREAEWKSDRLQGLAAELVGHKVDIIVAWSTPAARAAKRATNTIPIVAAVMADPVEDELVTSLARPGGNITGTTFLGPELVAKRLQLLREVVPGLSRVAALWHPSAYGERTMASVLREIEGAARTLGMQLQLAPASSPDDFASAFSAMTKERAESFIVLPSPMLFGEHKRIVGLAAENRLPGMYQAREFVDGGGLMSYGVDLPDLLRRSATYVNKILRGAKPAELPVEQPTKFELVINLKTARELGLTVSRDFLLIADDVIE
jgi:putative ABC transport system substrate-binding protein